MIVSIKISTEEKGLLDNLFTKYQANVELLHCKMYEQAKKFRSGFVHETMDKYCNYIMKKF